MAPTEVLTRCPACGSGDLKSHSAPPVWIGGDHWDHLRGVLGISRCRDCGLTFTNPRPSEHELLGFYQRSDYDCHQDSFAAEDSADAEIRISALEHHLPTREGIVDFGCGAGALLQAARRHGWRSIWGVEVGEEMRERLNQRGFSVAPSLSELRDNLDGPIAALTMVHVFEHLTQPQRVLQEVRDLLSPAGVLLIEVPNVGSLRARLSDTPLNSHLPRPGQRLQAYPIHLCYFGARSLCQLLRRRGFDILEVKTLGIGVEELLRLPARGDTGGSASIAPRDESAAGAGRLRSPRWRAMVKGAMSRLRLGEHLMIIARVNRHYREV